MESHDKTGHPDFTNTFPADADLAGNPVLRHLIQLWHASILLDSENWFSELAGIRVPPGVFIVNGITPLWIQLYIVPLLMLRSSQASLMV
jgi:hypothetical protein